MARRGHVPRWMTNDNHERGRDAVQDIATRVCGLRYEREPRFVLASPTNAPGPWGPWRNGGTSPAPRPRGVGAWGQHNAAAMFRPVVAGITHHAAWLRR